MKSATILWMEVSAKTPVSRWRKANVPSLMRLFSWAGQSAELGTTAQEGGSILSQAQEIEG